MIYIVDMRREKAYRLSKDLNKIMKNKLRYNLAQEKKEFLNYFSNFLKQKESIGEHTNINVDFITLDDLQGDIKN